MTNEENQVRKFYEQIWNQNKSELISEVLHERIEFRGSLGMHKSGHSEFKEYLDMIHQAVDNYHCKIDDLVREPNKLFAKMTFTGIHKGEFMNYPPTGKRITWLGTALFTFEDAKVIDLWVLGDLMSLDKQLNSGLR